MISFLTHLKKHTHTDDTRWIVKYDKNDKVREIKQIYKPSEYYSMNLHKGKNARPLHNKNALIKILDDDKEKNNS
tara:strand:+ start:270 stop:494 length:225 start_codon:yes stop_codon:yes gene_type:complete